MDHYEILHASLLKVLRRGDVPSVHICYLSLVSQTVGHKNAKYAPGARCERVRNFAAKLVGCKYVASFH